MKKDNPFRSRLPLFLPIGLVFLLLLFSHCQTSSEKIDYPSNSPSEKQKGVHVYGRFDSTNFQFLSEDNIEWVTIVAWSSQKEYDSPIMGHHNGDSAYIRSQDSAWVQQIKLVKGAGFKVFIKPHIWLNDPENGKWRSDIYPANEENWALWKQSYRDYIYRYARLAEQGNADMFCIGTELTRLAVEKPLFWQELIQEVRQIYSGNLTYAANWHNEYEKITFWGELDYIGVQAYFPLAKNSCPTVEEISKGWEPHFPQLEAIHEKYNRQVLFTELGYKSTTDGAIKPWEWVDHNSHLEKTFSKETQANCYQAFFDTVWEKEWFAGVHIWVMRPGFTKAEGGNEDLDFSPQGKPAESIIAKGFQ